MIARIPDGVHVGITGLGAYVPDQVLTNDDLARIVETSGEWIVSRTGIRERRIAEPGQATSDLALEAALAALGDAGADPGSIDLVIVATASPDMFFPATVRRRFPASRTGVIAPPASCSATAPVPSSSNGSPRGVSSGLSSGATALSPISSRFPREALAPPRRSRPLLPIFTRST